MRDLENIRQEYVEVNNNHRHYSNLRFAVFSVYFAILGGLVSVAFEIIEIKSPDKASIILYARVAGLLFTFIFFSFEVLCELNLRHLSKLAKKLEKSLHYRQFRTRRMYKLKAYYFTWAMYFVLMLFWLVLIFRSACILY